MNAEDAATAFYGAALSFNAIGTGNAVPYNGPGGTGSSAKTSSNSYSGAKNNGSSHSGFSTPHGKDLINTELIAQQKAAEIRQQLQDTINSLKNQLSAYNGSLSDINTQIENLTKISNMTLDQFTAPKINDLNNNSGGSGGGGSGTVTDPSASGFWSILKGIVAFFKALLDGEDGLFPVIAAFFEFIPASFWTVVIGAVVVIAVISIYKLLKK